MATTYGFGFEFVGEVAHIEAANNGFIVKTANGTFVAKTMREATKLLADNFEPKQNKGK